MGAYLMAEKNQAGFRIPRNDFTIPQPARLDPSPVNFNRFKNRNTIVRPQMKMSDRRCGLPPLFRMIVLTVCGLEIAGIASARGENPEFAGRASQPRRRVIMNHDGDPAGCYKLPCQWEKLLEESVLALNNTHVDTIFWCLDSQIYYDDRQTVFMGRQLSRDDFTKDEHWQLYENVRLMIGRGRDMTKDVVDAGHRVGMEVFASVRMNDLHDSNPRWVDFFRKIKRDHPEYMLGDSVNVYARPGITYKFSPKTALNYALAEVREYQLNHIRDTLERYDVDGLELDWNRSPWAFEPGQERAYLGLMTQFMRQIRQVLDSTARQRGRPRYFAVSVPRNFESCLETGLDVRTWLDEKLIDILIVAGQPFLMRLPEMKNATRQSGCQLYSRLSNNPRLLDSPEVFHAAAALHHLEGVDGIYLFNFFDDPEKACVGEIGEPEALARLDKHYKVPKRRDPFPPKGHTLWRPVVQNEPLPMFLVKGAAQVVPVRIADDIASAVKEKSIRQISLRVGLVDLMPGMDRVSFRLNGERLAEPELDNRESPCWLEFQLDGPPIKRGDNRLEILLEKRDPQIHGHIIISDVELIVRYR